MMILKRFRQEHGKETLIRGFSSSEGFYYLNHCLKIQIQNKDVKIPKIPCFGDSSELVARIAAAIDVLSAYNKYNKLVDCC
jgi:hypothetical protein